MRDAGRVRHALEGRWVCADGAQGKVVSTRRFWMVAGANSVLWI
jgi:hypothetical protein